MKILEVKKRCIEVLDRVEHGGAYVHLALQEEARRARSAPEEYPVLVQLVRGVLEQKRVLLDVITPLLSKNIESLPRYVQYVLCLGAYQLLFLDKVKKRDVVFEAVELVKTSRFRGFSGLVNAVLRRIDAKEEGGELKESITADRNFPKWLRERWIVQFGEGEVSAFCEASQSPLPMYFRVNTCHISRDTLRQRLQAEGVVSEPCEWSTNSLRVISLPEHIRVHELEAYRDGSFFIQDLSSSIVADLVCLGEPLRVRDVCAAPGGKACAIAATITPKLGRVYASDRSSKRVELIRELVKRLHLTNVENVVSDALEDEAQPSSLYDAVLLDAPCSGFGTIGRKVDMVWSRTAEDIDELVLLQNRLLARVSRLVEKGGMLVYSTCTIETAENEDVVERFLSSNKEFELVDLRQYLPETLCTAQGMYRAWPHRHAMAGAFACCLRRLRNT
jgi:16S rRNA (cytosine967-C5)-methyltransferase